MVVPDQAAAFVLAGVRVFLVGGAVHVHGDVVGEEGLVGESWTKGCGGGCGGGGEDLLLSG